MRQMPSACSVRAAARPGRRPEPHLICLALLLLGALGCGVRTGPPDETQGVDDDADGDGVGPVDPASVCAECDGSVVCTHCYIQGYDVTYRCRPAEPAPSPSCLGLGESHTDQFGSTYTCYYCS